MISILRFLVIPVVLVGCGGQNDMKTTVNENVVVETLESQVDAESISQEVLSETEPEESITAY